MNARNELLDQTISTLNALGYDGEQCVRELPEIMKALKLLDEGALKMNGLSINAQLNGGLYLTTAILAKCKAKG